MLKARFKVKGISFEPLLNTRPCEGRKKSLEQMDATLCAAVAAAEEALRSLELQEWEKNGRSATCWR